MFASESERNQFALAFHVILWMMLVAAIVGLALIIWELRRPSRSARRSKPNDDAVTLEQTEAFVDAVQENFLANDEWRRAFGRDPQWRQHHRFWYIAHNCIAHPLIGLFPGRLTWWIHDRTGDLAELGADQ